MDLSSTVLSSMLNAKNAKLRYFCNMHMIDLFVLNVTCGKKNTRYAVIQAALTAQLSTLKRPYRKKVMIKNRITKKCTGAQKAAPRDLNGR